MNSITTQTNESLLSRLALPFGTACGLITTLGYVYWLTPESTNMLGWAQSDTIKDLYSFTTTTLKKDPLLVAFGISFFLFYYFVSTRARNRGLQTARFLGLFKSTGFSISLALVAAKLPRILEKDLTSAAAIAPVYHTLGWITLAVAAACLVELARETYRLLTSQCATEKE